MVSEVFKEYARRRHTDMFLWRCSRGFNVCATRKLEGMEYVFISIWCINRATRTVHNMPNAQIGAYLFLWSNYLSVLNKKEGWYFGFQDMWKIYIHFDDKLEGPFMDMSQIFRNVLVGELRRSLTFCCIFIFKLKGHWNNVRYGMKNEL